MAVPGAPRAARAAAGRGPCGLRGGRGGLAVRRAAPGAGKRCTGRGVKAGAHQHAAGCARGRGVAGLWGAKPALTLVLSAGDQEKGEMGLGAVPGRQAAFREGLEQAVLYAKALGCPRYPALPSLDLGPGREKPRLSGLGHLQTAFCISCVSFCIPRFQAHLTCWVLGSDEGA